MNRSGITLINFKSFLNKYLNLRPGSISAKGNEESSPEINEQRVSFLEQNLSFEYNRKEWIAVESFPELAASLNPNYLQEDPWLEIVHLN